MNRKAILPILSFLERFYSLLTFSERKFFENIPFLKYLPDCCTISVGNLSTGGTGKTPVLMELLKTPYLSGRKAVLTRGYKSFYERSFFILHGNQLFLNGITDEALLINRYFPEIPVFLGKNRFHSAVMAEKLFKPDIIFLDDGFQYRRIRKDCEIVLWDSNDNPEEAYMLPRGKFREPLTRLFDAGILLLTKCESVNSEKIVDLKRYFYFRFPQLNIFECKTIFDGIYDCVLKAHSFYVSNKNSERVFAFCAIATPESFFRHLENSGFEIVGKKVFRDHYFYSGADLDQITKQAAVLNARPVCTEKDYVKIMSQKASEMRLLVFRIRTEIENAFYKAIADISRNGSKK
ncbi:MAG: tetraacyldisaccharide 4'-kinase [Candidatus Riflebacteria bacterium]|nr:tetraacyldisaccharide 4'-kinase [Candidatus Riflebacteria bacterium]